MGAIVEVDPVVAIEALDGGFQSDAVRSMRRHWGDVFVTATGDFVVAYRRH